MGQNVENPCEQPIMSLRADLYGNQTVTRCLGDLEQRESHDFEIWLRFGWVTFFFAP